MKVCVIGMGYIGFPTSCIIARAGHDVVGVEINQDTFIILKNGDIHIKNEEGLLQLYQLVKNKEKLLIKQKPEKADIIIIAVPTPCSESKKEK